MQLSSKHAPGRLWTVQGILACWGCIVFFRAGYELCKSSVTQDKQSETQQSDGTTGSPCQSWDGQCEEVHLFRRWQGGKAGIEEELLDLHESGLDELAQQVEENLSANDTKVTVGVPQPGTEKPSTTKGAGNLSIGKTHGLPEVAEKALAEQEFVPATWGQGLKKLQARLNRQQQMDLENLVQEESKLAKEQQAWAKAFSAEVVSYERELCADESRRDYEVCIRLRAEEQKNSEQMQERSNTQYKKVSVGVTAWAAELAALKGRLEAHRAKKQQRREVGVFSNILPVDHGGHGDDGHHLIDRIADVNKRLCDQPERRTLPSCAQFQSAADAKTSDSEMTTAKRRLRGAPAKTTASGTKTAVHPPGSLRGTNVAEVQDYEAHLQKLQSSHAAWEEAFSTKVVAQMREMCSDLRHRSHGRCRDFLKHDIHAAPDHLMLHWPPQVAASNDPMVVANTSLLLAARWSGRIPTVACITMIPRSLTRIETWLEAFIFNFRHQHYEGSKSLVLVYHHSDQAAAKMVRQFVDGTFIMSAVAWGDEFPSATAARFGMWHARGADLVARWDFEAWHHPDRLSMQVRALTLSARPASLLARWTVLDNAGGLNAKEDGVHWDGSLVGKTAWMQKYWYPFLQENDEIIAHEPQDIVSVDEPGLLTYDSLIP